MPRASTASPIGVMLKKPKPALPLRTSSLCTTMLGAVATSVSMPLVRPATLMGISRRAGELPRRLAMLSTMGMKMATTPVELITAPRPATVSISRISKRVSLLPERWMIQSPNW